jgi:hypothetical protein
MNMKVKEEDTITDIGYAQKIAHNRYLPQFFLRGKATLNNKGLLVVAWISFLLANSSNVILIIAVMIANDTNSNK